MSDFFFDLVVPFNELSPPASADYGFLKKVAFAFLTKDATVVDGVYEVSTQTAAAAYVSVADAAIVKFALDNGLPSVTLVVAENLAAINTLLDTVELDKQVYTLLFGDELQVYLPLDEAGLKEIAAKFDGVIGFTAPLTAVDRIKELGNLFFVYCGDVRNQIFALSKFLGQNQFKEVPFLELPFDDGIKSLGDANILRDARASFSVVNKGKNYLSFMANEGAPFRAAYVQRYIRLRIQELTVSYITLNKPDADARAASMLQAYLENQIITPAIKADTIEAGSTLSVSPDESSGGFGFAGDILIDKFTAAWFVKFTLQRA